MSSNAKSIYELTVCRLCLEPVTNFICTDCLLVDIEQWGLGDKRFDKKLLQKILHRHNEIKKLLNTDLNGGICIICRSNVEAIACPCCYLYEIFLVIKDYNPQLAEEFEKYFNFDFVFHHGFTHFEFWHALHGRVLPSKHRFVPLKAEDRRVGRDLNLCDSCEQESSELMEYNGEWLCESCSDDIVAIELERDSGPRHLH